MTRINFINILYYTAYPISGTKKPDLASAFPGSSSYFLARGQGEH